MTRINAGIPPRLLSDKHLLAEHREIKRIPNHLRKYGSKCAWGAPQEFTLGKGHFLFFIDKGLYTKQRYTQLRTECIRRGFTVTDFRSAWDIYNDCPGLLKGWKATLQDTSLVIDRLKERDPKYYANLKGVAI